MNKTQSSQSTQRVNALRLREFSSNTVTTMEGIFPKNAKRFTLCDLISHFFTFAFSLSVLCALCVKLSLFPSVILIRTKNYTK